MAGVLYSILRYCFGKQSNSMTTPSTPPPPQGYNPGIELEFREGKQQTFLHIQGHSYTKSLQGGLEAMKIK